MTHPDSIARHESQQVGSLVFREVRTATELREVLALRYIVYHYGLGLVNLTSLDHASRLDADVFDLYSRHFALFDQSGGRSRVVGTLRITSDRPSPSAGALHRIVATHPTLVEHLSPAPPAPLPMLSYLAQAAAVRAQYERWIARGDYVAEAGRLTVHPSLRVALARRGLRLSHFIIECAHAFAWFVEGFDRVLMDCDVCLESLYRRFGFEPLSRAGAAYQPGLGITFTVLHTSPHHLPAALRPSVEARAREMRESGQVVMRDPRDLARSGEPTAAPTVTCTAPATAARFHPYREPLGQPLPATT